MSFFRDFKKIIALFLAIILLFFSALVPVKRARAVVIETVAVVSLIAVGLVACGIAVASTDNGEDTSTALGYAVNYVNTKMQDAQKTAFQVGLYTATGAINLGSQAWQWIKEASANIYLNSSKYIVDSTGNTVQIGNLNNWGNCRYLSGTFYVVNYYNRQTYYVSTDVVYDSSIGSGIFKSTPPKWEVTANLYKKIVSKNYFLDKNAKIYIFVIIHSILILLY